MQSQNIGNVVTAIMSGNLKLYSHQLNADVNASCHYRYVRVKHVEQYADS